MEHCSSRPMNVSSAETEAEAIFSVFFVTYQRRVFITMVLIEIETTIMY